MARHRSTLLTYNTVERLLRGDFFHFVTMGEVAAGLREFAADWPLLGVGTSNWYRRNGELIVEGRAGEPRFLWADPSSTPAGRLLDLGRERPAGEPLLSPVMGADDAAPQFPFLVLAACDPGQRQDAVLPAGVALHDWLDERMREGNQGLAAISVEAVLELVEYSTICHIPAGGLDVSGGYARGDAWNFGRTEGRPWRLRGIYAANPTIQRMVSAEGRPLHFHGHAPEDALGGHVNLARTALETRVTIHPVKDLLLEIRDLDVAWLPTKPLPD